MVTIPFALSVHHFISSVGADAGFAAFIAVALLVLLFFSQARETANLRRRADEAGQRVQDLEGQLYALSEQVASLPAEISVVRAAGSRIPFVPGVAPAPAGVAAGSAFPPAAPAGMGAPALAAATRLIPDPDGPFGEPQPATVGLVDQPLDQATELHPSPMTVSGGNGTSHRPVPAAATMQRPAQARPGGPARPGGGPPRGAQGRPVGGQGRPGGPPRSAMAIRPGGRRSRTGRVFTVLAVLLIAGAVVAGVLVIANINHGSSQSKSSAEAAARARAAASRRALGPVAAVKPVTVTVSVLNGTDTSGLAGAVSSKLGAAGYQKGFVGNFTSNQTQTATSVLYMRGAKRDATAVAAALKLHPNAVQPIDQSTQQIACPPSSGPCKSTVVVTVGSDLSNLATQ
jgi:LytR cell envelope-related transcriptional attenuator